MDDNTTRTGGVSRRSFLGRAAAVGGGVLVGGGAGFGIARASDGGGTGRSADGIVPFYGARQAGIATPAQDRLAFAAFDVTSADVGELTGMLGSWAAAAALMTRGEPIGPTESRPQSPAVDTGEALGSSPADLTVTVGFGPSLFDRRFGLSGRRPAALRELPTFAVDELDPTRCGGDIGVQACSDDPQVAFHVIRNFARIGRGVVAMRWSELGFGRTSSTSAAQVTPRNLFGFKDGTNNIKAEDSDDMDAFVWVDRDSDQAWMVDGTYLVARRISMHLETWDADYIADQEKIFGRRKVSGAPLTGTHEHDPVDLSATTASGRPVIDPDSHIRLASPLSNAGEKILRRGYSFTDGTDPTTGSLDAGLFFICFNRDPERQFVAIQRRLGSVDLMNEYITHTGSAIFAVPPGVREAGDWFGRGLFQ
jgi:deferrochelatase/peroxidase EfeB